MARATDQSLPPLFGNFFFCSSTICNKVKADYYQIEMSICKSHLDMEWIPTVCPSPTTLANREKEASEDTMMKRSSSFSSFCPCKLHVTSRCLLFLSPLLATDGSVCIPQRSSIKSGQQDSFGYFCHTALLIAGSWHHPHYYMSREAAADEKTLKNDLQLSLDGNDQQKRKMPLAALKLTKKAKSPRLSPSLLVRC